MRKAEQQGWKGDETKYEMKPKAMQPQTRCISTSDESAHRSGMDATASKNKWLVANKWRLYSSGWEKLNVSPSVDHNVPLKGPKFSSKTKSVKPVRWVIGERFPKHCCDFRRTPAAYYSTRSNHSQRSAAACSPSRGSQPCCSSNRKSPCLMKHRTLFATSIDSKFIIQACGTDVLVLQPSKLLGLLARFELLDPFTRTKGTRPTKNPPQKLCVSTKKKTHNLSTTVCLLFRGHRTVSGFSVCTGTEYRFRPASVNTGMAQQTLLRSSLECLRRIWGISLFLEANLRSSRLIWRALKANTSIDASALPWEGWHGGNDPIRRRTGVSTTLQNFWTLKGATVEKEESTDRRYSQSLCVRSNAAFRQPESDHRFASGSGYPLKKCLTNLMRCIVILPTQTICTFRLSIQI